MAMFRSLTSSSSSKVVSHAIRAISSRGIPPSNAFRAFAPLAISHQYFSSDAKKKNDRKLVQIIKSELKLKETLTHMPAIPKDFPFTLEDNPWESEVTLCRDFHGEKISVGATMPWWYMPPDEEDKSTNSTDNDDDDDSDSDSDTTDSDEEDEENKRPRARLYLTVKVSKLENGIASEFEVTAYADGTIDVDYYVILKKITASESTQPIWQRFMEHDLKSGSDMENALKEFLKIRGIEKSNYEFLFDYLINKHKNMPLATLKELMNLIGE